MELFLLFFLFFFFTLPIEQLLNLLQVVNFTQKCCQPCFIAFLPLEIYRPAKWESGSRKHQTLLSVIGECHCYYISSRPDCTNLFKKKTKNKQTTVWVRIVKWMGEPSFLSLSLSLCPLLLLILLFSSYCSDTCRPGMHRKAWPLESLAL